MNPDLTAARKAVRELADVVGWLDDSLLPGTPKPWRAPVISAERRSELDAQARAERLERTDIAPGDCPAPYDFDVADEMSDILVAIDALAEEVATAAWRPADPPATSAFESPERFLRVIETCLDDAVHYDPSLAGRVVTMCSDLAEHAKSQLGLMVDGQVLATCCPWCDGRDKEHPVGGGHTMKVRLPQYGDLGPLVVCEGTNCDPPRDECGTWYRGRPAWPMREWEWLGKRFEHADAQRAGTDTTDERTSA